MADYEDGEELTRGRYTIENGHAPLIANNTIMLIRRSCFGLALASMAFSLMLTGCGSARRGEPVVGSMPITSSDIKQGQKIFMKNCHQCHPGGEAGLGPAINNKPLPKFLMRFQVRHGFGAMPAFSEREISEEELDRVLAYLRELKAHG